MDGIINIYKPKGITSFKCVAAVRRKLGVAKAGHAGTLDPEADGVLPVCVGRATRLSELFLTCPKSYKGRVLFGAATDTQDIWGKAVEVSDADFLTDGDVQKAAECFKGEIFQTPPAYSALKVDGVPMYKKARAGQDVKAAARKVNIYDLSVGPLSAAERNETFGAITKEAEIEVSCSRGTYIRTLCFDLGEKVGLPACMSALTRTSYGPMRLENAVTLEELFMHMVFLIMFVFVAMAAVLYGLVTLMEKRTIAAE